MKKIYGIILSLFTVISLTACELPLNGKIDTNPGSQIIESQSRIIEEDENEPEDDNTTHKTDSIKKVQKFNCAMIDVSEMIYYFEETEGISADELAFFHMYPMNVENQVMYVVQYRTDSNSDMKYGAFVSSMDICSFYNETEWKNMDLPVSEEKTSDGTRIICLETDTFFEDSCLYLLTDKRDIVTSLIFYNADEFGLVKYTYDNKLLISEAECYVAYGSVSDSEEAYECMQNDINKFDMDEMSKFEATYDDDGKLTELTLCHYNGSGSKSPFDLLYRYTYDENGQRVKEEVLFDFGSYTEERGTMTYTRDEKGLLIGVVEESKNGNYLIITVRRSRQSGVARATCPD